MLRKYTRYDAYNRASSVWINDDHIIAISPSGEGVLSISTLGPGYWLVKGEGDDLANYINYKAEP